MGKAQPDEEYSEAEAQRRFLEALKGGLNTAPKPLKDKPKARKKAKRSKAAAVVAKGEHKD